MLVLAQADTIATKALDTITSAIQGGLVGVAIILGVAVIVLSVAIIVSNRGSNRNMIEMMKFNGRLATSLEKMDTTLDKMSAQQGQISTLFAELTVTLRDIPKTSEKISATITDQIGLMRKDFTAYAKLTDGTLASVQNEMKDLQTVIERRLGEINGKLQKIKPDTKPIPALPDAPIGLPEVSALSSNSTEAGDK